MYVVSVQIHYAFHLSQENKSLGASYGKKKKKKIIRHEANTMGVKIH